MKAIVDYQAWPETVHAARVMRKQARITKVGHNHIVAAAVVFTAFSVEAFIQTLGPFAYGDSWSDGDRPGERRPLREKLKCIGKKFGVQVSYGAEPWSTVSKLIAARDSMAHPRPALDVVDIIVEAVDGDQALRVARDQAFVRANPMHSIIALDAAADAIEEGLLEIWVASGGSPHALKSWSKSTWSISLA